MRPRNSTLPSARHGLKAWKRSPNSTLANTSPTQKMMKTNVGAKLSSGVSGPKKPAISDTSAKTATPISPHAISTPREPRTRPSPPGSGRQPGSSSRGRGHSAASATNERQSTAAAAQPNSHSGIGRLERCTSPWAKTVITWRS